MAARVYQDNLPKADRQREFGLIAAGNGFYNLVENPEALEVIGSKFGKSNAMGDMSLECNASASGTTVTISHPSGVPAQIWFDAPKAYSSEDTYLFKGGDADPVPLIMLDSAGEELSDEAFKNSRVGAFLKQTPEGLCAFFKTGSGGSVDKIILNEIPQLTGEKVKCTDGIEREEWGFKITQTFSTFSNAYFKINDPVGAEINEVHSLTGMWYGDGTTPGNAYPLPWVIPHNIPASVSLWRDASVGGFNVGNSGTNRTGTYMIEVLYTKA